MISARGQGTSEHLRGHPGTGSGGPFLWLRAVRV